jgi:hypothetical protein
VVAAVEAIVTATVPAAALTSQAMMAMLRRHYLPDESRPGGIFLTELPAPDGTRRADAIWQGVTASAGRQLVGHEIKVSRADVLVELADPTKCDQWLRYCNRWWLVVAHPSLIEGLDLPPSWGVLAPPSGRRRRTCTVVHPAPELQPVEQGPALRAIATRLHWDGHNRGAKLTRELSYAQRDIERLRAQVRELEQQTPAASTNPLVQQRQTIIGRVIDELGGTAGPDGIGTWRHQVTVDDLVTGLRDLGALKERRDQVRSEVDYSRRDAARLAAGLQRLLAEKPGGGDPS